MWDLNIKCILSISNWKITSWDEVRPVFSLIDKTAQSMKIVKENNWVNLFNNFSSYLFAFLVKIHSMQDRDKRSKENRRILIKRYDIWGGQCTWVGVPRARVSSSHKVTWHPVITINNIMTIMINWSININSGILWGWFGCIRW